jgi:hypothetical protein
LRTGSLFVQKEKFPAIRSLFVQKEKFPAISYLVAFVVRIVFYNIMFVFSSIEIASFRIGGAAAPFTARQ